jgi:hypothetical protein
VYADFTDSSRCHQTYIRPVGAPEKSAGQTGRILAERYLSSATAETLASHVRDDWAAAAAMSIRHIQTIYVPADETCFTLFEAPSPERVLEASERFELGYRRVMPAITFGPPECGSSP